MNELRYEDVQDLALGAKFMGGGGGGDTYTGQLMAQEAIREFGSVKIWAVDEVPPGALVVSIGMMGGTTVMAERLPNERDGSQAIQALESYLERKVTALMSYEMAGINGVLPVVSAARMGLPLVDGDLMGRAFPGIHMTLATVAGISATPMVVVDTGGSQVILETPDNIRTEIIARSLLMDMGGAIQIAFYPMNGEQLPCAVLAGSMNNVLSIGRTLREARDNHKDAILAIQRISGCREFFRGKVTSVNRQWQVGYDYAFGEASIEGAGVYKGEELTLKFQNEYLLAAIGRHLVATVPDNIIVLHARTTNPFPPEFLEAGMDLVVFGLQSAKGWRTQDGLAIVGPRAFGYDADYHLLDVGIKIQQDSKPC
jgi:DUF917 family protein